MIPFFNIWIMLGYRNFQKPQNKSQMLYLLIFGLPFLVVMVLYLRRQANLNRRNQDRLNSAVEAGLTEPPSLHPVIDPVSCIGCGSCVPVCPEHALGLIDGKGALIDPTHCIGHGACAVACPVKAINLVFGTEKRGMDIPQVSPEFETNVPGIFIAGELGGMGLIRKTTQQGIQAIEVISKRKKGASPLDVVIIGAGPAGIAATLAAKEKKLRYVTVEQEDALGGSVYHYPRNKLTMTAPVKLPLVGTIKMFEIRKEELLGIWNRIMKETAIKINFFERMEKITPTANGFSVLTSKATYETNHVLLAIGRRGTPRKLGVPGEEQHKVVYRLIDADQYRGMHVLVVGGGDSALEAAISIAEEAGSTVTLSYRSEAFGRVKEKNRHLLQEAEAQKKLTVMLKSGVKEIGENTITLDWDGKIVELPNQAVIVCAGGILPTPFLKEIGIMVETHHGKVAAKDQPRSMVK
jgi:thioredoxin reductase/Pyruvate/2-oxoacid:ferredoxin oxidoreductase delta subunit